MGFRLVDSPTLKISSSEDERQNDDEADDEELIQIRARRLEQLKAEAVHGQFGTVELITAADFVPHVNNAGEGVPVVVFLFKPRHYASSYMLVVLETLAKKFGHVKFLKILFTDCIPNYPDKNVPTLLVYRDDELLRQFVGLSDFGGSEYGIEGVFEWI